MTDTTNHTVLNPPPMPPPPTPLPPSAPSPGGMGRADGAGAGDAFPHASHRSAVVWPRRPWWGWVLAAVGLIGLLVISLAAIVPSSVVAEKENERLMELQPAPFAQVPASAEPVNGRVRFGDLPDGVERYVPDGEFFFVTVSQPQQTVLSWFAGRGDPAVDFITAEDKFGVQTPTQRRAAALQQMRTANQEAQFVALTAAGYEPEISLGEVVVQDVLCRTVGDDGLCAEYFASDDVIDPFDTLLEVDGLPMGSVEDLTAVLADRKPGDVVTARVRRPEVTEPFDVDIELSASPDDETRAIIGFRPFDTRVVTLPFEVDIDTGQIGGPSAGLAFTLALIDELTPGELTGGKHIAITGTISLDGAVGPIGGLAQKVSAVHQHGVDVFLVPASQFEFSEGQEDLRQKLDDAGHGDVRIIPVANLDEALQVLEDLGGDPLVPVRPLGD